MFTGLVEAKGKIESIQKTEDGAYFWISTYLPQNDLKIGDSITVNGACQTIVELNNNNNNFKIYSSYKTLELTNFNFLNLGDIVNLERSLLPTSRMGGHIVQGHVDGIGKIIYKEIRDNGNTYIFKIEIPLNLRKYIIERGSITIDGISLTVVKIENTLLELVLIPETINKTNASQWENNSIVNIETDILARYYENFQKYSE
jgi:riboflavin synthase